MANDYETRLIRVLDYIHSNPNGDLSLDALADIAALSRFHFHRIYHAMIGETAAQTVRRSRLYLASLALVQSKTPLAKIAASLGFASPASFVRSFTDTYGLTPTAFRKRGELRPQTPTFLKGTALMYPIEIRLEPARQIAAIPHSGAYSQINRAFEKLGATLAARGLFEQAGQMIGVYYDDPTTRPEADLRSHAGVEFSATTALAAPLERITLPKGRHAILRYTGPYSGLPAAYEQLYRTWLPSSGELPANSPPFEIYHNTPMDTAPESLITEICLPLT